jgi:hypothetical protein
MRAKIMLIATATALLAYVPSGWAATVQPAAGTYQMEAIVHEVVGTCPLPVGVGDVLLGAFTYPGPNMTGAKFTLTYNTATVEAVGTIVFSLPKTPGMGVTSWNGTATVTIYPYSAAVFGPNTITFAAGFGFATAHTFTALFGISAGACNNMAFNAAFWP